MTRAAFNQMSNGMDYKNQSSILEMNLGSTTVTCEATYGFLPCTTVIWGYLFLIVVYEYLLSLGQKYVNDGSNLFFKTFGTGIFGASLFHLLGTIPQVAILLVNGILGSTSTAEGLASMGIGMLAGSAVMTLTVVWGSCVAFGSYDLSKTSKITETSSNSQNKKQFSLTGFGVTTDAETTYTGRIMLVSMIPFLILQLPKIVDSSTVTRVAVLVSLIITLVFLFFYCFYQMFQPWIQNRRLEFLMHKYAKDYLLRYLLTPDGYPNTPVIREIFNEIDQNNYTSISTAELRALILGIQLEDQAGLNKDSYVSKVMEEFDSSGDGLINETEFVRGISKWLSEVNGSAKKPDQAQSKFSFSRSALKIYGSVFMSNMTGLTTFLLIVYIRDLSWEGSAQVLVVLIIGLVMGIPSSFCTKFPFWTCIVAYLLYPISLLLIYVLATVLGWS